MIKVAWSKSYCHPLPTGHRFPMEKYDLISEQLIHEGILTQDNFFAPQNVDDLPIIAVHDEVYLKRLKQLELDKSEIRKTGFPLSEALVDREINILSGTIAGAQYALDAGVAMNVAGGTHHAFTDHGEGFCLLNDQAVGAQYLMDHHDAIGKILIVDLDVHQGNGTAQIFSDNDQVFTFSMHGEKNYPMKKERSNLDVALVDNTGDEEYLQILRKSLSEIMTHFQPDFIFYQSGVDVLATDKLGRLSLTLEGCKRRDEIVIKTAHERQVPIHISMGGGYSKDIKVIVNAHVNTFRIVQDLYG
ncbi:MAG: histone deacetylase [Cyclobacteriaceae bacterium]